MKFKRGILNFFVAIAAVMLGIVFTGCVSIDYVGQKLTPLKSDQNVTYYNETSAVPANTYKTIGRAMVVAPDGTSYEDIRFKLMAKARECGADAIQVIDFKRIKIGQVNIPKDSSAGEPVGNWAATANRADGSPIYTDMFSGTVPLKTTEIDRYEIKLRVLFLANKQKYLKEFKQFEEERDQYITTPAKPADVSK